MERPEFLNEKRKKRIVELLKALPKGDFTPMLTSQLLLMNGAKENEVEDIDDWSVVTRDSNGMPDRVICTGIEDGRVLQLILFAGPLLKSCIDTIDFQRRINKIYAESRKAEGSNE
jgi:hypothetical protein